MTRLTALSFLLSCSSLLACGGDAPADAPAADAATAETADAEAAAVPEPASESAGACAFLSEAAATAAFGKPMHYRSNDGSDNCVLDSDPGGTSVDFMVQDGTGGYTAYPGDPAARQSLEGVGDRAFYVEVMGEQIGQVVAVKGDRTLAATVSSMNGDPARPVAVAFAQAVLANM